MASKKYVSLELLIEADVILFLSSKMKSSVLAIRLPVVSPKSSCHVALQQLINAAPTSNSSWELGP